MADRVHVFVQGRVQGVGFRYSVHRQALALGLAGWVRNLPDGRVEAEFEGPRPALEEMLEWCGTGAGFAKVTHLDAAWESGPARYTEFHVRG